MAQQTITITIPKWTREIAAQPKKSVENLLRTFSFLKMKEYERQIGSFREKYKIAFNRFEKKAQSGKKENAALWDDYLVWKGLELAHQMWEKRYHNL